MSSTVAARVTATLVGAPFETLTATLGAAPAATAHPATIFDPNFGSPVKFDSSNPLILFIVQAFIIVGLSRLLHFGLRYLRQPKVIAEVIAGILIGPSALGRVPGFTSHIFPPASVPYINLVANIGLCLFLFLVGLEVDFSLFRRNLALSSSISFLGLIVPFGLGAAVSKGIYERFVDASTVDYGTFLLFIGTANAITAFPVLARILTDENLLRDHVGVIVLSAGVGNDVIGWILLALAIALVNSTTGIIVLYVILTSIGWTLVLWFVGRPLLKFVGRKTRSFGDHGPSQSMTAFVLFLVLTSAWITDRIGVHAIFGAFLVGLVVPKEIRAPLTEKIEDLVTVLFLPLYFALSGLKTDLGLLKDGSIWGWVVCVCIVAFASKFISCGGVAKAFGMDWRESGAVGSLMACKGLVELIVLNVGLNAKILNPQVFAMFVVMALVTTFTTTPLTLAFYPAWYRIKAERLRRGLAATPAAQDKSTGGAFGDERPRTRFAVVVEQFEHLPAVMAFLRLVQPVPTFPTEQKQVSPATQEKKDLQAELDSDGASSSGHDTGAATPGPSAVQLALLRIVELTDRTSALFRSAESEQALLRADPLSVVLRAFTAGLGARVRRLSLALVAQDAYARQVAAFVEETESELVVLPWALPGGALVPTPENGAGTGVAESWLPNPLEALFGDSSAASVSVQSAVGYASALREVFAEAPCDVALFLDRSSPEGGEPTAAGQAHLFLAFHGGSDDRLALALVLQLVRSNPGLRATVLRFERAPEPTDADRAVLGTDADAATRMLTAETDKAVEPLFTVHGGTAGGDTLYPTVGAGGGGCGGGGAGAAIQSETEDDVLLSRLFPSGADGAPERVHFETVRSAQPLSHALARLGALRASLKAAPGARVPLVVFAGRGRRDAPSHAGELRALLAAQREKVGRSVVAAGEVRRALGDVGSAVVLAGEGEGADERVVVVQRGGKRGRVPGARGGGFGAQEMSKGTGA
ncbi:K(+)/H(+) antiporter [Rhodotorula kratochvilovae]